MLLISFPFTLFAQFKDTVRVEMNSSNCAEVRFVSKRTKEMISKRLRVSVKDISVVSASGNSKVCRVKIDSPKGVETIYVEDWNGGIFKYKHAYFVDWNGF